MKQDVKFFDAMLRARIKLSLTPLAALNSEVLGENLKEVDQELQKMEEAFKAERATSSRLDRILTELQSDAESSGSIVDLQKFAELEKLYR